MANPNNLFQNWENGTMFCVVNHELQMQELFMWKLYHKIIEKFRSVLYRYQYPGHEIHSRTVCTISTPWGGFIPYGHCEGIYGKYLSTKALVNLCWSPFLSWVCNGKCISMPCQRTSVPCRDRTHDICISSQVLKPPLYNPRPLSLLPFCFIDVFSL